jgi:hypothetical protein
VMAFAERDPEPRDVIVATGMILFDILGRATNHAHGVVSSARFHDRPPVGV